MISSFLLTKRCSCSVDANLSFYFHCKEDRWYHEGFELEQQQKSKGFNVELFFTGDADIDLHNRQIKRLADSNVDALVIGSIDGNALSIKRRQS